MSAQHYAIIRETSDGRHALVETRPGYEEAQRVVLRFQELDDTASYYAVPIDEEKEA